MHAVEEVEQARDFEKSLTELKKGEQTKRRNRPRWPAAAQTPARVLLTDQSRFALLKLILNRNRKDTTMEIMTELTVETNDAAYNCGRLLAILAATREKTFNADKKRGEEWATANGTIIGRYFGTVCWENILPRKQSIGSESRKRRIRGCWR